MASVRREELETRLAARAAKGPANCAKHVGRCWDVKFAASSGRFHGRREKTDYLCGWHARGDGIKRHIAHNMITIDEEDRGLGDTAPLAWVVNIPVTNNAAVCVTQDSER